MFSMLLIDTVKFQKIGNFSANFIHKSRAWIGHQQLDLIYHK